MVKFSKELEAQLIPEWKDAFVDYKELKKHVKKIKLYRSQQGFISRSIRRFQHGSKEDGARSIIRSSTRTLSTAFSRASSVVEPRPSDNKSDGEDNYEVDRTRSQIEEMRDFLVLLGRELEKVDDFYKAKETEFTDRFDSLNKQVQCLSNMKQTLKEHPESCTLNPEPNNDEDETPRNDPNTDQETNEITRAPPDNRGNNEADNSNHEQVQVDTPQTHPSPISAISKVIWEDIRGAIKKDILGEEYINKRKIEHAEKMIREAFVELYRGLSLLQKYRSLNIIAFTKILKKFDKVSRQEASASYSKVVNRSYFVTSEKMAGIGDEIEALFIKHITNGDRKKAMRYLRPNQPKDWHIVTFFVGLFTGVFVTLFCVYAILAHFLKLFDDPKIEDRPGYKAIVYEVFIAFALVSLHIFLYGCNLLAWRNTRINNNFIFEFKTKTALKHRDAFFIAACIMTTVVCALMAHLIMIRSDNNSLTNHPVLNIPSVLLMIFAALVLCPFNIFYRSTRLYLLKILWIIALSPLYKVVMAGFFMGDQLTSQVPLLRHIQFILCYVIVDSFKKNPLDVCTNGIHYRVFSYIIPFLPYYWRALQCVRRYFEEGYDKIHLANTAKYVSALLATGARIKYVVTPTPLWLALMIISSLASMLYNLYWDFVIDWGFFTKGSRNALLRDKLVLKNHSIYYVSIVVNLVLRLAWVETVLRMNVYRRETRMFDFVLASLEVIRRGHWNYYRVENEHLNNVGKFRAIKTVPLPFRDLD